MRTRSSPSARRLLLAAALAALGFAGTSSSAQSATTLCVGGGAGCYGTIQAAISAAVDGDTIAVAPGTYNGPITIAKSIQVVGAGAALTTIQGGGPVLTVGAPSGASAPTVSIGRVTITGGLTTSTLIAAGGGVFIPGLDTGNATAATVSIDDSVISSNQVSVTTVVPPGAPCGPPKGKVCSYALGGGIENDGHLALTNTKVTDNVAEDDSANAPPILANAGGGGIDNHPHASLTMTNCVVSGNRVSASGALAQSVSGGGIADSGALTIANSEVSGNSVELATSLPGSIFAGTEALAEAGGIDIQQSGTVTIANSTINSNTTTGTNTGGDVNADTGGIDSDGSVTLNNSAVENNQASSTVPPGSGFFALALGGGLEIEIGTTTLNNSSVDGNSLRAESDSGLAAVLGAGLMNEGGGTLTLHNSRVFANTSSATGAGGFADGAGIFNSLGPGPLTLVNSTLTGNTVTAGPGITPLGGGLFTADVFNPQTKLPATLVHTVIAGNSPDQCVGC
jgi:hypothetical protein